MGLIKFFNVYITSSYTYTNDEILQKEAKLLWFWYKIIKKSRFVYSTWTMQI
jgi:hypothetical protein